jgi:hypothetical protein
MRFSVVQRVIVVVLLSLSIPATAGLWGAREPLTFAAMGDGPRQDVEWPVFEEQIAEENSEGRSAFIVHVGDIWHGCDSLPEAHYARVADALKQSAIPVVIVPGDNEWNDLDDPDEGWTYWKRHLLGLEGEFDKPIRVRRQAVRPENVAWMAKGVLMVGLNLVGGTVHNPNEWEQRHHQNVAWVRENIDIFGKRARAAVVFAQARPGENQEDFFAPFVETVSAYGKPVLYLHGDGHRYDLEEGWRAPNLTRIQIDQVAKNRPLLVTVTGDRDYPFLFDRRLKDDE